MLRVLLTTVRIVWQRTTLGTIFGSSVKTAILFGMSCDICHTFSFTVYPPQAVRQVILAVDSLVAGGDVAEVAGLLHTVRWWEWFKGEQAVVAVHLTWYICSSGTNTKWRNKKSKYIIYFTGFKNSFLSILTTDSVGKPQKLQTFLHTSTPELWNQLFPDSAWFL